LAVVTIYPERVTRRRKLYVPDSWAKAAALFDTVQQQFLLSLNLSSDRMEDLIRTLREHSWLRVFLALANSQNPSPNCFTK
jgi:hypothetical protein